MNEHLTRRTFLGYSAAASAVALQSGPAFAAGANSEITMGFIGMGGRGNGVAKQFLSLRGVRAGAFCDPDTAPLEKLKKKHPKADFTQDLRRVLDDKSIDAVMITTPNHWHCLAAIWALQAGKHVYVEKPLSHNVWEGRQLVNLAAKSNLVAQIGTQQRSDPMQAEIKQFLHEDKNLGKPLYVQACRYGVRKPIGKRDTPLAPPPTLDYDLWLGPAEDVPIFRSKLHYDWHWDFNAGSGEMGNWGPHVIDDVRNVALLDEHALPSRVFACGGRIAWNDAGTSPNLHFAYYDTPTLPVFLGLSNLPAKPGAKGSIHHKGIGSGYVVHCEGGYYAGGRGSGRAVDNDGKVFKNFKGNGGGGHVANFLEAVRAGDPSLLTAPVSIGNDSTNWCHLANIAYRAGGPVQPASMGSVADGHPGWENLVGQMHDHLASYDLKMTDSQMRMGPVLSVDGDNE
ncbi:MAG: Gfo/Idh/MocA family protein, partial [Aeoliella sp.]